MTLDEIAQEVPGYPGAKGARRQAFERDKRLLRDEGIPVVTEAVDGPEQFGYRIDPEAFYLPDLELHPDEQAALHLAVAGVHLGDPSGRDALLKLGATGLAEARPVADLHPPEALVPLFDALASRAAVTFTYRGVSPPRRSRRPGVPARPLVPGGLGHGPAGAPGPSGWTGSRARWSGGPTAPGSRGRLRPRRPRAARALAAGRGRRARGARTWSTPSRLLG